MIYSGTTEVERWIRESDTPGNERSKVHWIFLERLTNDHHARDCFLSKANSGPGIEIFQVYCIQKFNIVHIRATNDAYPQTHKFIPDTPSSLICDPNQLCKYMSFMYFGIPSSAFLTKNLHAFLSFRTSAAYTVSLFILLHFVILVTFWRGAQNINLVRKHFCLAPSFVFPPPFLFLFDLVRIHLK